MGGGGGTSCSGSETQKKPRRNRVKIITHFLAVVGVAQWSSQILYLRSAGPGVDSQRGRFILSSMRVFSEIHLTKSIYYFLRLDISSNFLQGEMSRCKIIYRQAGLTAELFSTINWSSFLKKRPGRI